MEQRRVSQGCHQCAGREASKLHCCVGALPQGHKERTGTFMQCLLLAPPSHLPKYTQAPFSSKSCFCLFFLNNVKMSREGLNQRPPPGARLGGRGDARWGGGGQVPEASGPHGARRDLCCARGLWAQKSSVQFSSKTCGCPAMGLPASCGSKGVGGVRGIRGLIWGAGWRAWASCLAHGGGEGGPSLRHLPRGCVSVRGNGSIVHTRFCSQALFLGCKGAGSLGSQFSTGPENRE